MTKTEIQKNENIKNLIETEILNECLMRVEGIRPVIETTTITEDQKLKLTYDILRSIERDFAKHDINPTLLSENIIDILALFCSYSNKCRIHKKESIWYVLQLDGELIFNLSDSIRGNYVAPSYWLAINGPKLLNLSPILLSGWVTDFSREGLEKWVDEMVSDYFSVMINKFNSAELKNFEQLPSSVIANLEINMLIYQVFNEYKTRAWGIWEYEFTGEEYQSEIESLYLDVEGFIVDIISVYQHYRESSSPLDSVNKVLALLNNTVHHAADEKFPNPINEITQ